MGGEITRHDTYFTLSFIQIGFIVTVGALVPPLLALYGWSHDVVWRVASAVTALPVFWFVASVPGRRRAATGQSVPAFVWTLLGVQAAAALALVLRAAGALHRPGGAVYASAVTVILIASGIAYLLALSVILPDLMNRRR
jgi:hypothetical protein